MEKGGCSTVLTQLLPHRETIMKKEGMHVQTFDIAVRLFSYDVFPNETDNIVTQPTFR